MSPIHFKKNANSHIFQLRQPSGCAAPILPALATAAGIEVHEPAKHSVLHPAPPASLMFVRSVAARGSQRQLVTSDWVVDDLREGGCVDLEVVAPLSGEKNGASERRVMGFSGGADTAGRGQSVRLTWTRVLQCETGETTQRRVPTTVHSVRTFHSGLQKKNTKNINQKKQKQYFKYEP